MTGSGTDLLADSRVLFTLSTPLSSPGSCWTMHATPDGGTVICGTQYAFVDGGPGTNAGCANGGLEFTAYSVRTGKPVRVLYQYQGPCSNGETAVLWMNASGTEIIGATQTDVANQGGQHAGQVGVMTGGHIRLLKLPEERAPHELPDPQSRSCERGRSPARRTHRTCSAAGPGGPGSCWWRGRWRSPA